MEKKFDKVDRALEMRVIDWLQWSEFPENIGKRPDDSDMAQLALTLISKRKQAFKELLEIAQEMDGYLDCPGPWDLNSTCLAEGCNICLLKLKFSTFKNQAGIE